MIVFLSVKVFPRRRLLLELACLPSTANPRASSFKSLPQDRDFNAQHLRTITFECVPSEGTAMSHSPIAATSGVTLIPLVVFSITGTSGVQARDVRAQDGSLGGHGEAGLEQGRHEALQRPLQP